MRASKDETQDEDGMDLTWVIVICRRLLLSGALLVQMLRLPEVRAHQGVLPVERMLIHVDNSQLIEFGR